VFEFRPDPLFSGVAEDTVQISAPTLAEGVESTSNDGWSRPRQVGSTCSACSFFPRGFFNESKCWLDRAISVGMDALIPRFQPKEKTDAVGDTGEGGPDQGDVVDEDV